MYIIRPRLHKATKADGFRGKTWEIIKRVSGNNIGKLRYNGRGR